MSTSRIFSRSLSSAPSAGLRLAGRRRASQRRLAAARQLILLERSENVARARNHRRRQPREPRHLDAVAAIRSAGENLVQEDDVVLPLPRRDVIIDDPAE